MHKIIQESHSTRLFKLDLAGLLGGSSANPWIFAICFGLLGSESYANLSFTDRSQLSN